MRANMREEDGLLSGRQLMASERGGEHPCCCPCCYFTEEKGALANTKGDLRPPGHLSRS